MPQYMLALESSDMCGRWKQTANMIVASIAETVTKMSVFIFIHSIQSGTKMLIGTETAKLGNRFLICGFIECSGQRQLLSFQQRDFY